MSVQIDAYLKKEPIGTLFVRWGHRKHFLGGGGVAGGPPPK